MYRPTGSVGTYRYPGTWNDDDFSAGVVKYGVKNYDGTTAKKIAAPKRTALLPPPPDSEVAGVLM